MTWIVGIVIVSMSRGEGGRGHYGYRGIREKS